jgi:type IV pilus assembly protein PilM
VAATIKAAMAETSIREKKVYLGAANQRVVVRQVTLPYLPDNELRQSLSFQVQEFIPIPVEAAELDFHTLEVTEDEQGQRFSQLLLVAAQKDMIAAHVDVAERAGLKPVGVDLNPFAVLRSLYSESAIGDTTEVLVDIGAGVTSIVVHANGVPLFVRVLVFGGDAITDAIARAEGSDTADAEARKWQVSLDGLDEGSQAAATRVDAFVDELRSSLGYFRAQSAEAHIQRVVLCGGSALMAGLKDRLAEALHLPVEVGSAFALTPYSGDLDDDVQTTYGSYLVTAVGLALGGLE